MMNNKEVRLINIELLLFYLAKYGMLRNCQLADLCNRADSYIFKTLQLLINNEWVKKEQVQYLLTAKGYHYFISNLDILQSKLKKQLRFIAPFSKIESLNSANSEMQDRIKLCVKIEQHLQQTKRVVAGILLSPFQTADEQTTFIDVNNNRHTVFTIKQYFQLRKTLRTLKTGEKQ